LRAVLGTTEGRIGVGLTLILLFVIAFGRFFVPYPPNAIGVGGPTETPSAAHLLGTDQLGRDVLSRMLVGGTTIILIPLVAVSSALLVGGTLGMIGAYRGDRIDLLISRVFDVILAVPALLIVLITVAALGPTSVVLVLTFSVIYVPSLGRIVRGATHGVVTHEYVAAAQARGERTVAILFREVIPNIVAPVLADYALRITYCVLAVATLNFLGLGVQPPQADWGAMVAQARGYISVAPLGTLAPAAAIALLSIAVNLTTDALTQHLTQGSREIVPL
jgi:peptide/nickel transport system permease protein